MIDLKLYLTIPNVSRDPVKGLFILIHCFFFNSLTLFLVEKLRQHIVMNLEESVNIHYGEDFEVNVDEHHHATQSASLEWNVEEQESNVKEQESNVDILEQEEIAKAPVCSTGSFVPSQDSDLVDGLYNGDTGNEEQKVTLSIPENEDAIKNVINKVYM